MPKLFISLVAITIGLFVALPVFGAPLYRIERSLLPEVDSTYYLGTTTPSQNAWRGINTDTLNILDINSSGSTRCLQITSAGVVQIASAACSSGGGGGSSGGTWSTTTSQTAGVLINYPNNDTDVVTIGDTASTTAEVWFDPTTLTNFFKGKVGVGTTTPLAQFSASSTSYVAGIFDQRGTSDILQLQDSGTSVLVVKDGGFVGIGTTSPTYNFSLQGASVDFISTIKNTTAGGDFLTLIGDAGTPVFNFVSVGTGGEALLEMYGDNVLNTQISGDLDFPTYFNGTNVGIGSTTPWAKLSVTNTGSAPSFIVEDSTSPDTTPFIVDASGKVLVSTTTSNSSNANLIVTGDGVSNTSDVWITDAHAAILQISGNGSGVLHSGIRLDSGGNTRAAGIFTYDDANDAEFYFGRGRANEFVLNYRPSATTFSVDASDADDVDVSNFLTVDSSGKFGISSSTPMRMLSVATDIGASDIYATSSINIPNGSAPTVDAVGEIALDTTTPGALLVGTSTNASYPGVMPLPRYQSFMVASSTWTSTSTMAQYPTLEFPERINGGQCYTNAGTVLLRIGDGTNWSNATSISTATTSVTFTSNNRFNQNGVKVIYQIGTPASSPTQVNCTMQRLYESI